MAATTGIIPSSGGEEIGRVESEQGVALGRGAPTVYLPWLRRYWSLWLESDARNDAWIR